MGEAQSFVVAGLSDRSQDRRGMDASLMRGVGVEPTTLPCPTGDSTNWSTPAKPTRNLLKLITMRLIWHHAARGRVKNAAGAHQIPFWLPASPTCAAACPRFERGQSFPGPTVTSPEARALNARAGKVKMYSNQNHRRPRSYRTGNTHKPPTALNPPSRYRQYRHCNGRCIRTRGIHEPYQFDCPAIQAA